MFKFILMAALTSLSAYAVPSKTVPAFAHAAYLYASQRDASYASTPEIRKIIALFKSQGITPEMLAKFAESSAHKAVAWQLPADDQYDLMAREVDSDPSAVAVPEISLHATKLDVIDASDSIMKDNIYVYFFVTDGLVPTGKVSSVYEGLSSGESFFFNAEDRAIFPLPGIAAKAPNKHLIVDYGIVESDGDDITAMQKLSSIIVDMAIAVYASAQPESAPLVVSLRKEIKALSDFVIARNRDDRLVSESFAFRADELNKIFNGKSFVDFKKTHGQDGAFRSWKYRLHFRLLK